MKPLAFLSMDSLANFVSDDLLTEAPLQAVGWSVETVSWRQRSVDWSRFCAVIIRSPWDYQNDLPAFLNVLSEIDRQTLLLNPIDVVRWNADKVYLRELELKGVPIVPTLWGESISAATQLEGFFEELGTGEIVVKPTVSANADFTYRFNRSEIPARDLLAVFGSRPYLAQPFMSSILEVGEYSLFYFNGEYSHCILKTPKPEDFRVQEEHGGFIRGVNPSNELIEAGQRVLNAIQPLLYARVDLVRDGSGAFLLMEVELIEPSLYLRMDSTAPANFARAIDQYLGNLNL